MRLTKKKKTLIKKNEKEFVFGKEKDFLLNRFSYIFLWIYGFKCSNIPKTNELFMTKKWY